MIQYPLQFKVHTHSPKGVNTPFTGKAGDYPEIPCAVPKEFNGPGGGYSPEDLFSIAVIGCLTATFKVFAEKTSFAYSEFSGEATLTIDRGASGIPELTKLDITMTLSGVEDEAKAKVLLAETEKYCLVSNAIKSEKNITYNINPQK